MIATKGPRRTKAVLPLTDEQRRMAERCVGLAERVARSLGKAAASMDEEERVGWGMIGLLNAVATFDPEEGASLRTWVGTRVRAAILDACRDGKSSLIKTGRRRFNKLGAAEASNRANPLRLDANVPAAMADRGVTYISLVAAELDEPPADMESIWFAVRCQGGTAAAVFDLYYNRHWSMKRIGEHLGISESRVSQIHSTAIAELRTNPRVLEAVVA